MAEFLVGLSLVADLGMGQEPGDAARACLLATRLADRLGLAAPAEVYYTTLLQHCGCTAFSHEASTWLGGDDLAAKSAALRTDYGDPRDVVSTYLLGLAAGSGPLTRARAIGSAVVRAGRIRNGFTRANCEVAAAMSRRVGLGAGVERGLSEIFEQWDGKGLPQGLAGEDISAAARCAQIAGTAALFDRLGGPEAAVQAVRRRAGRTLDPDLTAAYLRHARELHEELAAVDPMQVAVEAEPGPQVRVTERQLDDVCRAFGDAVDLKGVSLLGHSAGVAALAEGAGRDLGLAETEVVALRRAGHLADLGRVAVSTGIWERPGPLTSADWEQVRLHAYHTERILSRCPPLAPLAALAGAHHERLDGSGYHRQSGAAAIPMTARILAAADTFQALLEPRQHRDARSADAAADVLREEVGRRRLDPEAVRAVLAAAGRPTPARPDRPDGLTERQVEVLRLVAAGLSNPEIAKRLVVSRRTAEHHVQDIYARIGVSSRASAALYAMEHGLLS
jgi:HD-GYP domain-containing protein (c-di-GMP phosphodiesterase class II)